MSNRRKLTVINPGSGQRSRPRQRWRPRPPRSGIDKLGLVRVPKDADFSLLVDLDLFEQAKRDRIEYDEDGKKVVHRRTVFETHRDFVAEVDTWKALYAPLQAKTEEETAVA